MVIYHQPWILHSSRGGRFRSRRTWLSLLIAKTQPGSQGDWRRFGRPCHLWWEVQPFDNWLHHFPGLDNWHYIFLHAHNRGGFGKLASSYLESYVAQPASTASSRSSLNSSILLADLSMTCGDLRNSFSALATWMLKVRQKHWLHPGFDVIIKRFTISSINMWF